MASGANLRGVQMDSQTRCAHYHQLRDVIALKHYCCDTYYPCHLCHAELADHQAQPWPADRFDQPAVLCGVCQQELSVNEYRAASNCPHCQALFNPGCSSHAHLYFEL
ncbi:CHY zinc finger protein [Glutamicibacter mishrai]|uniref:CHY zinc finger protein n=1 Tax=Glutamicibacter mishrai TaxID=1775880 RepID=UPI0020CE6DD4|nr:CHY zinc finger protein [Glutamicibacter mishrai]UTT39101.1 CHY zinc finger protein [Glutamicibacter mishrai]